MLESVVSGLGVCERDLRLREGCKETGEKEEGVCLCAVEGEK